MALAAPAVIVVDAAQDVQVVVTLSSYPAGGITSWTTSAPMRAYDGGPVLATGSVAVTTDVSPNAVFTITFAAAGTNQPPGAYVWDFERTDTGQAFKIIPTSSFRIVATSEKLFPTITNLSELWAQIGYNPATIDDNRYKKDLQLLNAAESFVRRYCGNRVFAYGTYTEYLDATPRGNPYLKETPIWTITSAKYDGNGGFGQIPNTFGTDTLLTAGTDYQLRIDNPDGKSYVGEVLVYQRGANLWWGGGQALPNWGRGYTPGLLTTRPTPLPGAFQFIYTGGYAVMPDDLKLAVWELTARLRAMAQMGLIMQSESMEGYSYSLGQLYPEMMGSVENILNQYRHGESYFA